MSSPQFENILPGGADTLLTITGVGGFQYQARDLTQTLDVIPQTKHQLRTINARLRDFSNPAFRKYISTITCKDTNAPPLDGLFPGDLVTVDCALMLSYLTGNPGSPFRDVVSGSSHILGPYSFYRPRLDMMVRDVGDSFEEWKSDYTWKLVLEEV